MKRSTPETIRTPYGTGYSFVIQEVNGAWYVFPSDNTDDDMEFWGAVIAGCASRADALARFKNAMGV